MSIPVEPTALGEAVAEFGPVAYLLTAGDDGRPHATHVTVTVDGAEVSCGLGRRTARNGQARPLVSLLWSPHEPGGYSLIADGELTVSGTPGTDASGTVRVTTAVLHRPAGGDAPAPTDGSCESDCAPVEVPTAD